MTMKEEIRKYWGNNLVKVSLKALSQETSIFSEETKTFLSKVGLPVKEGLLINFKVNSDCLEVLTYKNSRYLVLGDDFGTKICLQEKTEEVFSIDDRGEYPTRFINSGIEPLIIFLQVYDSFQPILAKASDDEVQEIIQKLKQKFIEVDSKALLNKENWWMVVLEQVGYGLL